MNKLSVRGLTVCGVFVAVAFVLSFLRLFSLPLGGSVTLCSMLFVCIIGYMYGPKYGLIAAFTYGILQFVQNPEIYSIPQVTVDYFLAFTALGLSGFVNTKRLRLQLGYLLGITGRFFFATLSGYVFWGSYTPDGWNPLVYSVCYNGAYIYAEGIITLIILSIPAVKSLIDNIAAMSEDTPVTSQH